MKTRHIAIILLLAALCTKEIRAQTSGLTPAIPLPQTQLQSGASPYLPLPLQPGVTVLGTSQLQSSVTSSNQNPVQEISPVALSRFNLGGTSTVPGADSVTGSTNATNATNATSGKGFAKSK